VNQVTNSSAPDATVRGLGVAGGVITAAGIVLAGTFAALTRIPRANW
jgi:uncharacterized membrane protein YdfJ with MMPL/SSD domain